VPPSLGLLCLLGLLLNSKDSGSEFLHNVSEHLPDYTVSHPRRQQSWDTPTSIPTVSNESTHYKTFQQFTQTPQDVMPRTLRDRYQCSEEHIPPSSEYKKWDEWGKVTHNVGKWALVWGHERTNRSQEPWKRFKFITSATTQSCLLCVTYPLTCKLILVRTAVRSLTRSCPETTPSSSLSILLQLLQLCLTTDGCHDFRVAFLLFIVLTTNPLWTPTYTNNYFCGASYDPKVTTPNMEDHGITSHLLLISLQQRVSGS
jgi:hypothetical protein